MAGIVDLHSHPLARQRRDRFEREDDDAEPSLLAGDALRDIAFAVQAMAGAPQVDTPPETLLRNAMHLCERAADLVEE